MHFEWGTAFFQLFALLCVLGGVGILVAIVIFVVKFTRGNSKRDEKRG